MKNKLIYLLFGPFLLNTVSPPELISWLGNNITDANGKYINTSPYNELRDDSPLHKHNWRVVMFNYTWYYVRKDAWDAYVEEYNRCFIGVGFYISFLLSVVINSLECYGLKDLMYGVVITQLLYILFLLLISMSKAVYKEAKVVFKQFCLYIRRCIES